MRSDPAATRPVAEHAAEPRADKATESEATESETTESEETESVAESLRRLEATVSTGIETLISSFESRLSYDRVKEKQIDALHEEVRRQRGDLVARTMRPLLLGVIRLHDDIGRSLQALRARDPATLTPERLLRLIDGFREDLEIVLGQNGVEAYREPGDTFAPERQRALETEPASEPARVGRVARRLRPGFELGGEILLKERVAVWAAAPQEDEPQDDEPQDDEPADVAAEFTEEGTDV